MKYYLSLKVQAWLYALVFMALQAEAYDLELTDELRARCWKDVWPIINALPDI